MISKQGLNWLARRILPQSVYSVLKILLWSTYRTDGLMTFHVCHFMNDPKFREAYAHGHAVGSWDYEPIQWRAYVCCWAAARARDIEGDFVECGVWRGGLARVVTRYVDFKHLPKKFYLLDTFEGIDASLVTPEERKIFDPDALNRYHYDRREKSNAYESVKASFADLPNVELVKGRIPESLSGVKCEKVAYLSIDMNNATPEIAAAEYFWPKMSSGAMMILDDYAGSEQYRVQRQAFDKFAADRGVQVLNMPTGQGLIFKP
jgi:hypothetical protein